MFRTLIPELSDRYHLVAPDYPGLAKPVLSRPAPTSSTASSGSARRRCQTSVDTMLGQGSIHIQDYGALIGLRLPLCNPHRVQ